MSVTRRVQTRRTTEPGESPADDKWQVLADTGPIVVVGEKAPIIIPSHFVVAPGTTVSLDGTKAIGESAAHSWSQPHGTTVSLTPSATAPIVSFIAPDNTNAGQSIDHTLGFELSVTDAKGQPSVSKIDIRVLADPSKNLPPQPQPPQPPQPEPPINKPITDIGPDGVKQLYKTAAGGSEFYLNVEDPYKGGAYTSRPEGQFNISYGSGSQFPFTKKTEGSLTFFNTEGSPITYASGAAPGRSVRLDVYAAGGKWANKTKYSWKDNPGYLYKPEGIGSGEFTVFIRTHGDLGTHQAYACKIGGRDEDDLRSLIEMVYPTASHSDVQVNYNYAHFPYVNAKPTIRKAPPKLVAEKWIGVKCVHKIAADKKSTDWELWYDDNPFDDTGKVQNNWQLSATYTDKGCKEYDNIPLTWKAHKDLCRVDGFKNVDFALISDREIDASVNPSLGNQTVQPQPPQPQPPQRTESPPTPQPEDPDHPTISKPTPSKFTADVINHSSKLTTEQLQKACDAIKKQMDNEVAAYWSYSASFNLTGEPVPGNVKLGIFDDSDQPGAAGWHSANKDQVTIECFYVSTYENLCTTISHEMLETISDYNANTTVEGHDEDGKECLYWLESADPVEEHTYFLDEIQVSNFVTPAWFAMPPVGGTPDQRTDYMQVTKQSFDIADGGYMQVSYDDGKTWKEVHDRKNFDEWSGSRKQKREQRQADRKQKVR